MKMASPWLSKNRRNVAVSSQSLSNYDDESRNAVKVGQNTSFGVDVEHLLIVASREGIDEPRLVRNIGIGGCHHGDKLATLGVLA